MLLGLKRVELEKCSHCMTSKQTIPLRRILSNGNHSGLNWCILMFVAHYVFHLLVVLRARLNDTNTLTRDWAPCQRPRLLLASLLTARSFTGAGITRDGKNIRARRYPRIKFVTDSYYPRVAGILIPGYKRVGYGYHTIRTREYPLPAKN